MKDSATLQQVNQTLNVVLMYSQFSLKLPEVPEGQTEAADWCSTRKVGRQAGRWGEEFDHFPIHDSDHKLSSAVLKIKIKHNDKQ